MGRIQAIGGFLILLGFILAVTAMLLFVHDRTTEPEPPPGAVQSEAKNSVKPSAKAVANYSVPVDNPKYIVIPAIGVKETRILEFGLDKNGAIAVPDNIYDTGWYGGSSKPGQKGAMFIFGHVSSWIADGVFYNLKNLKPGDDIFVTRGDNKELTYKVVSTKRYEHEHVDMEQVLAPINASEPGLNLMTCAGQIIKGTSEFNERLVVFTSLVSS